MSTVGRILISVTLVALLLLCVVNYRIADARLDKLESASTAAQHTQERQFPICDTTRIPSYRAGQIVGYSINVNCETSPGAYSTYARFQRVER
jgi:hypothetical protein